MHNQDNPDVEDSVPKVSGNDHKNIVYKKGYL